MITLADYDTIYMSKLLIYCVIINVTFLGRIKPVAIKRPDTTLKVSIILEAVA
jgi:hypothetical protein